jgi:beta-lactam-binding protein with PASTA domain
MKRLFNLFLGALAMLAVALLSAFIAMRLAIHGREATVPNLAGLTITDASRATRSLGLNLTVENKFYSPATPPSHVLGQSPAPGSRVRREWAVRITESLGPQSVSIPNLVGQTERPATINLRRLSLDLGTIAHIPAPGDPNLVIAQTPPANANSVDSPRVSLLLSEPQDAEPTAAYVMPSLTGLTLSAAYARVLPAGLHIVSAEDLIATPAQTQPTTTSTTPTAPPPQTPTTPPPTATPSAATVVAQSPPAGHRVVSGDPVHLTLSH